MFVRFNTQQGKPKHVPIWVLLDRRGAETIISSKFAKKQRIKKDPKGGTVCSTPAGTMRTNQKAKAQFTIPELQDDKLIKWDCHVAKDLGSNNNMIIG